MYGHQPYGGPRTYGPHHGPWVYYPTRHERERVCIRMEPAREGPAEELNQVLARAWESGIAPPSVPKPAPGVDYNGAVSNGIRAWVLDILLELPPGLVLRVIPVGGAYWEIYLEEIK